ncbi:hypothetical protein MMC13_003473 [Lambiella insularis]|nr:hypothetical protein [Lambiella insularis]
MSAKSVHSRAAKRASSPSIDLDKSLKNLKPPRPSSISNPGVLSVHHGAGVTKRKGKGKPLSRQQRLRQEKGIERAEVVIDKKERKVERSTVRGKAVNERSSTWDELNGKIQEKTSKPKPNNIKDDEWEDEVEGMDVEAEAEAGNLDHTAPEPRPAEVAEPRSTEPDTEDEVL